MGMTTHARGEIGILPPLPWYEIKDSPFLPERARSGKRGEQRDIMFRLEESSEDTEYGVLIRREAVAIVQSWEDSPRNYSIVEHLNELIKLHAHGHTFPGHFDMEGEESGDIWRLYVRHGNAVRIDPVITWPEP